MKNKSLCASVRAWLHWNDNIDSKKFLHVVLQKTKVRLVILAIGVVAEFTNVELSRTLVCAKEYEGKHRQAHSWPLKREKIHRMCTALRNSASTRSAALSEDER